MGSSLSMPVLVENRSELDRGWCGCRDYLRSVCGCGGDGVVGTDVVEGEEAQV